MTRVSAFAAPRLHLFRFGLALLASLAFHILALPLAGAILGFGGQVGRHTNAKKRVVQVWLEEEIPAKLKTEQIVKQAGNIEEPPAITFKESWNVPMQEEPLERPVELHPEDLFYEQPAIEPVVTLIRKHHTSHHRTRPIARKNNRLRKDSDVKTEDPKQNVELQNSALHGDDEPPQDLIRQAGPGGIASLSTVPLFSDEHKRAIVKRIHQHRQYPPEAVQDQIEGVCTVRFGVKKDGQVVSISVVDSPDCPAVLAKETKKMVRDAAPYPFPVVRKTFEIRCAIAYRVDKSGMAVKTRIVASTGRPKLDKAFERELISNHAQPGQTGWQVKNFLVRLTVEFCTDTMNKHSQHHSEAMRMISYEGPDSVGQYIKEHLGDLFATPEYTPIFRIPIRFMLE